MGLSEHLATAKIGSVNRIFSTRRLWLALCAFLLTSQNQLTAADADTCAICGEPLSETYYGIEDKVTLEKRHVCKTCEQSFPDCFVCGLPANTNVAGFIELPDKRALCARDAKTAVLQEDHALQICREVREELDRLFSRFTSFPDTNVTVRMVDRVHLLEQLKLLGNDYHCPNVWGLTDPRTNHNRISYTISLMSGLPVSWLKATCAHECAHTWTGDHLDKKRKAILSRDAEEGFCELVAFLLMESFNDESQMQMILHNAYTRGQIDLFVAAYRTYGFNEILDWMQFGTDDRLSEAEPTRVRRLSQSGSAGLTGAGLIFPAKASRLPNTLLLKAIIWDQKHPLALINDKTLAINEESTVRVGGSNILVRCLAIEPDNVRLRVGTSGKEQTLRIESK